MPSTLNTWLTPDQGVELNDCDREPIHIPNLIQNHGVLLALDLEGGVIQKSQNTEQMFGLESPLKHVDALGFDPSLLVLDSESRQCAQVIVNETSWNMIAHRIDGMNILEFEPCTKVDMMHTLPKVNLALAKMAKASTRAEVFDLLVEAIQDLTGFDRAMAYEFAPEGHGHVVAETMKEGIDGFLGLRFPDTDIPKQAKRLYVLELTRHIPDTQQIPVPLTPELNPLTGKLINMAFCNLRAISPIHVKYLGNMGVKSSFSVSVVNNDELDAMIVCHNHTPKFLDFKIRQACETLARVASQNFQLQHETQRRQTRNRQLSAQVELLSALGEEVEFSAQNKAWDMAFQFVDSHALFIEANGNKEVVGQAPHDVDKIWELGRRFAGEDSTSCRAESYLLDFDPSCRGGGLLVVPVADLGWIGWYRQPQEQLIQWAGKAGDTQEKSLTPRASFNTWRQVIQGHAQAWSQGDQEMAEVLRRGFVARFSPLDESESSFERAMSQLREYIMYLEENNQALSRVNNDLRQFAYAASHDLKAPLRTIRSFLPLIRSTLEPNPNAPQEEWLAPQTPSIVSKMDSGRSPR